MIELKNYDECCFARPDPRLSGGSIRRNGIVVDIPPRASLSVKDADAWLAATEAKMEKFVDLKASKREQAYQWGQISDAMVIASRNAMADANAAARLNFISPPQTFAQFKAKWGPEKAGDALWDKIIAEAKRQMREPGCFVAGTLVHTKEGLRPIEQIKVGDLVLSKPESGQGEQSWQPVTKTFSYENRELYLVPMTELDRVTGKVLRYETEYVAVSGSHPIWVDYYRQLPFSDGEPIITFVSAWVTVEDYYLKHRQAVLDSLDTRVTPPTAYATLANGSPVLIDAPTRILKGPNPNEGVEFSDFDETWSEGCMGSRVYFGARGAEKRMLDAPSVTWLGDAVEANYDYTGYDVDSPMSLVKLSGGHLPIRRTVYNFEVANTHTYFVGDLGLWVHNKNPISVPLLPAVAQNVTQNLGVYVTQNGLALFHAALKKIPGNRGIGITPDGTVGRKLTDPLRAQALFVGSITESGVAAEGPVIGDKVSAYTLGGINPIKNGYPSTALGDALAWVVKNGKKVAPSNVLVDVKASDFGVPTYQMKEYVDAAKGGFVPPQLIQQVSNKIAKTLLQRSAFLEQAPEFMAAYAVDAEGLVLYKEFVSYAVKDTRLADALKALNPADFDPGLPKNINWTFDNWYSDKLMIGETVPTVVDGVARTDFGSTIWQLKKTYGTRADGTYGVTDAQWIARKKDDVIKPASDKARDILTPLIQEIIKNNLKPQEVASEGIGNNVTLLSQSDIQAILPAARQYWLSQGALASVLNSVTISIGQLPTAIAGQTQGNSITLSTDGAGWGWFVDATPTADEEFTPDATEQNLRATAGTAAAGKLDLLTVLIHELGHVLGAQDLARAEDVMSGHLEAGVRRLPTAQDTALWLAAQAKRASAANSSTEPAGFGVLVAPVSAAANQPMGGAVVIPAHATLLNGNFAQSSAQWETTGKVEATPSTITLGESTTAQAHLAQAFIITPQDRFLTFTISGLNLQTNSTEQNGIFTAAPQDAFEVALQNANTGANLLAAGNGNLGTHQSDALLNVQLASASAGATLQERAVSGLRHTDNADGSRTYVLNLSGIAAGTAVNLSFDLIGFGLTASQLGSQVSISDVRLISTPLAVNDTASLLEDGNATLTVQANDLQAEAAGFAPKLVANAQHGQVSINSAGQFIYTPDANFFGTDSFTYQYSNDAGTELSEAATVTLTVAPVNDAPVAADVTVTTVEDNAVAINLIAVDVDNTSANLQFVIQTQPAHGSLVQNADGGYSYTPVANYFGADSFTYTVTDGDLVSNAATVRINVTAVNDAPTLPSRSIRVNEDTHVSIDPLLGAIDVDGDSLTAQVVAGPQHGSLTVNADGSFSYQGNKDYFGEDSFTYRVSDGASEGQGRAQHASLTSF